MYIKIYTYQSIYLSIFAVELLSGPSLVCLTLFVKKHFTIGVSAFPFEKQLRAKLSMVII